MQQWYHYEDILLCCNSETNPTYNQTSVFMKHILIPFLFSLFVYTIFGQTQEKKIVVSESDYFGADLTQFPPEIREWIMKEAFPVEKMTAEFMVDPKLKAWWSEDGNNVLFEASYTIAPNYKGSGTVEVWGTNAKYSGSQSIYDTYGKYAKYHTLRFEWELHQKNMQLIDEDPCFASIVSFAQRICDEVEYDWNRLEIYHGAPVKHTRGKKYYVCEDYANEVMNTALQLECVVAVQKWLSTGHAWNVLELSDGRTLYMDLTWFDNEYIDEQSGDIIQQPDYDWANITFDKHLFKYSNVSYGIMEFEHAKGQMVERVAR